MADFASAPSRGRSEIYGPVVCTHPPARSLRSVGPRVTPYLRYLDHLQPLRSLGLSHGSPAPFCPFSSLLASYLLFSTFEFRCLPDARLSEAEGAGNVWVYAFHPEIFLNFKSVRVPLLTPRRASSFPVVKSITFRLYWTPVPADLPVSRGFILRKSVKRREKK